MNREVIRIMSKLILADKTIHIKLLGDSITHGVGGTGFLQNGEPIIEEFRRNPDGYCWAKQFREHCEKNYNCKVINNACTGTNLEFIIKNFDALVSNDDDIIICTIGTNNRHVYDTGEIKPTREKMLRDVYNMIGELYGKFKEARKDVIFVANIPASQENEKDGTDGDMKYWRILHMNDINDIYMKASVDFGFPFISLYNEFLKYCEFRKIKISSLLCDGLHPNDEGYDVMFSLIMRELGLGKIVKE